MPVGDAGWWFSDRRMGPDHVHGVDGGALLPYCAGAVRRRRVSVDGLVALSGRRVGPAGLLLHDTLISVASSETNFA
jgi:hypothetical protein